MRITSGQPTPDSPVHRAILVVDIENSTGRRDPEKARLRRRLYHLLEDALQMSGVSPADRDALVDRGDGVLVLIHPADHLPKSLLLTMLAPALDALVLEHNGAFPHLRLGLRMALHAGEIHHDPQGPFGEAIDLACRLLDSPELKATLKRGSAPTALAVSHHLYDTIVRHQYAGIDAAVYQPLIRVNLADTVRRGWVRQPRQRVLSRLPHPARSRGRLGACGDQYLKVSSSTPPG